MSCEVPHDTLALVAETGQSQVYEATSDALSQSDVINTATKYIKIIINNSDNRCT